MNKLIAFFLITVFMCANTSIGQLLKVPNLIEHYNEHKLDLGSKTTFSFKEFIKIHYTKDLENHHDEHHDLPFKTIDNQINNLFTFVVLNFQFSVKKIFYKNQNSFFYRNSFHTNSFSSIWQPPKVG